MARLGPARGMQMFLARHPRLYRGVLRLFNRGSFEKRIYLAIVRRGDVAFDVGANHGYFTLLFSDIVGPQGRVHAFEPVAATFASLAERMQRARWFDNVTVNEFACSDCAGEVTLFMPAGDAGQVSLRRQQTGSWADNAAITACPGRAIALDEYVAACRIPRVDFVKCDVEGAELLVLKGMVATLRRDRPLLFLEASDHWQQAFGYESRDAVDFLASLGYDEFVSVDATNMVCAVREQHSRRLQGSGLTGQRPVSPR